MNGDNYNNGNHQLKPNLLKSRHEERFRTFKASAGVYQFKVERISCGFQSRLSKSRSGFLGLKMPLKLQISALSLQYFLHKSAQNKETRV